MTKHEELVAAFRKAVDFEKRFGHRTDVPEVEVNWQVVVALIEDLCRKPTKPLSEIKLPHIKSRRG